MSNRARLTYWPDEAVVQVVENAVTGIEAALQAM